MDKLVAEEFESGHRQLSYRQGAKGKLSTRFWPRPVWCWEKARLRILVVRRDADDAFKYSLTNLTNKRDWEHYAWMRGQRFWIEHAFHEAKKKIQIRSKVPLLSTRDITELLDFHLPRKGLTETEVLAQIRQRRRQRQQDLDRRRSRRTGIPNLTK